jgi:hypothetical protein
MSMMMPQLLVKRVGNQVAVLEPMLLPMVALMVFISLKKQMPLKQLLLVL